MSDIYLQITETPTVVTLSAPVVSGALASTVTVANTVTVALDSNSLSALENVTVTVGAAITGTVTVSNFPASQAVTFSAVTISNFPATQTIAGTVTANAFGKDAINPTVNAQIPVISWDESITGAGVSYVVPVQISNNDGTIGSNNPLPISGTVTANPTGTQTIAGTVTASISNSVTIGSLPAISGTVTANNANLNRLVQDGDSTGTFGVPIVYAQLVAGELDYFKEVSQLVGLPIRNDANPLVVSGAVTLAASTSQIGSVTASISNSVVTFYPMQGTSVSNTNFTSVTASTTLVSAVANREVLTVFNESGTLFISPGATCTTVAYQVRLGSGDYWECPQGQLSLQHTGVYLTTGGTARVCQVS